MSRHEPIGLVRMLVVALLAGVCAWGCGEDSDRGELRDDAGSGPPSGDGDGDGDGKLDAGSEDGGDRSDAGGGEAGERDAGGGSCPPELSREPGPAVSQLSTKGTAACADTTLGAVIDAVRAEHPELDDITDLYVPDSAQIGDQSFIYAFATREGGFALVFRRGAGDCPSGCTENWYFYFRTDEACEPQPVGSYVPTYESSCIGVEGFALWDHPLPLDPSRVCGAPNEPWGLEGERSYLACGQLTACATKGGLETATELELELRFEIEQDADDPTRGTLTLQNTGHERLDGRALAATLEREKVRVSLREDNLPAACLEQEEIEVLLDFAGHQNSSVRYFEVRTPDCDGAPGDYCKGGLDLDLGNLAANSCLPEIELAVLVEREQALHSVCEQDEDCALVRIDGGCISGCEVAVASDYADTLTTLIQQAGAAYCADALCDVKANCAPLEAFCDAGRCQTRKSP